jgi:hypothetical protein
MECNIPDVDEPEKYIIIIIIIMWFIGYSSLNRLDYNQIYYRAMNE